MYYVMENLCLLLAGTTQPKPLDQPTLDKLRSHLRYGAAQKKLQSMYSGGVETNSVIPIAAALAHKPQLVLADEPKTG